MAVKARASITLSTIRDISSVTLYYKLQSSTASPPAKPTTNPPGTGWTTTEPTYSPGSTNSLYITMLTVYTDATFDYTDVSLSSSYEAAKSAYNKAQSAEAAVGVLSTNFTNYVKAQETIVGTHTANTRFWTGTAGFSELTSGTTIVYWLPRANASGSAGERVSGSFYRYSSSVTYDEGTTISSMSGEGSSSTNNWLNLTLSDGTETGWIPCYYGGTSRLTTQYGAGNSIRLTYLEDALIAGVTYTGWWADANYDTNTYDRVRLNNAIKAKTAIKASRLIVGDDVGYFHLLGGVSFDIKLGVLWAASAISANSTGNNNYIAMPTCTLRNNTSSSFVLTTYESCYLVGTLLGNIFTVKDTDFLVDAPPTEEDGYTYMYLGPMVSTYQIYLVPEHPMYMFLDGSFINLSEAGYQAYVSSAANSEAVRSVSSRLVQTKEDILLEVSETYATTSSMDSLETRFTTSLNQTSTSIDAAFEEVYAAIASGDNANAESIQTLTKHIVASDGTLTFYVEENGQRTPISMKLTNEGLQVSNGDAVLCYFTATGVLLPAQTTVPLNGTFRLGNFQWTPRTSGNLSILFVGAGS